MKFTKMESWPADHPIYSIGAVVGGQRSRPAPVANKERRIDVSAALGKKEKEKRL